MKISDIPVHLRPREKALHYGIEELNDQELIALIIGSGGKNNSAIDIADKLLKSHGNSLNSLSNTNYLSLEQFVGLKKSIALRLLATFEFHKRLSSHKYNVSIKINNINEVYLRYKYLEDFDHEELIILMLDLKLRIIKEKVLYKGTYDSFTLDIRDVIHELILAKAKYFILIHNHPDEETSFSEDDVLTTKVVEKSAKSLGIKLIDHLVIFKGGFSNFNEGKRSRYFIE